MVVGIATVVGLPGTGSEGVSLESAYSLRCSVNGTDRGNTPAKVSPPDLLVSQSRTGVYLPQSIRMVTPVRRDVLISQGSRMSKGP